MVIYCVSVMLRVSDDCLCTVVSNIKKWVSMSSTTDVGVKANVFLNGLEFDPTTPRLGAVSVTARIH